MCVKGEGRGVKREKVLSDLFPKMWMFFKISVTEGWVKEMPRIPKCSICAKDAKKVVWLSQGGWGIQGGVLSQWTSCPTE